MSNNNQFPFHPSSTNLDPLASQLDIPSSYAPQQTPPSTENNLFSSSAFHLSSSQVDPIATRRVRSRNELGDRARYLEGVDELLSESESGAPPADTAAANEPVKVIWGTNIVISETIAAFRSFLRNFSLAQRHLHEHQQNELGSASVPLLDDSLMAADLEPYYPKLLKKIHDTESYTLNLDCINLLAFHETRQLYRQLLNFPQELIPLMDMVINEYFSELFPSVDISADPIQVRPFNIGRSMNMRLLNPEDIDKLICIKGLIIRASNIIPDMRVAYFSCNRCSTVVTSENIKGRISEPAICPNQECGSHQSMNLIHNRSLFSDKQVIKIQETPDAIPDGQTPHTVTLCVYDNLVDKVRPGDRVEVTGIYRSAPVRINPRQRKIRSIFRTYIDVVHIKTLDSRADMPTDSHTADDAALSGDVLLESVGNSETNVEMSQIIALSQNPSLYELLSSSIAPSVWKLDNVKKSLLLQLFGGVSKVLRKSATNRFRGDINVLLAGDPGVSKSQLLQYVHKLAPRGMYTSGKGSSAVGLTAYVIRDNESGQLVLESGALVLSDGGICCIDEFDKMSENTRTILHEVMEQQTVSIAKAGIITSLNARTSILASANPIESKYNPSKSIVENLNLPPTILSRFDIICLLLDNIDVEADQRLARHITRLYSGSISASSGQPLVVFI